MDDSSRCDDCGALTYVDERGGEEGEWFCPSCLWARGKRAAADLLRLERPDPETGHIRLRRRKPTAVVGRSGPESLCPLPRPSPENRD